MSLFSLDKEIRDKWQGKLTEIKEVTREIWTQPFNPSFTDHGIKHSERLADYIERILILFSGEDDTGLFTTERNFREYRLIKLFTHRSINIHPESVIPKNLQILAGKIVFALEAVAYLHDIGMQCTSNSLHTKCGFSITNSPTSYNKTDLKNIRTWHHELSALWLEDAIQSSTNPVLSFNGKLRNIFSGIDNAILNTIIDACRYHSKTNIEMCCETHAFDEGIVRSKIMVLLMRIVDELDISRNRIDMAQIEHLRLEREAEYWWWYHYLIKHISVESSEIKFYINFNIADYDIGERLTELFAKDFQKKNGKVLGLLSDTGIKLNGSSRNRVGQFISP
jgi:hypothetical protein